MSDVILTLQIPSALLPKAADEQRVLALRAFQEETPAFGADTIAAQTFRISASKLATYVLNGQREHVDMPPECRYMRLFLMLMVGGDDIVSNYNEHRRFRGANVQPKLIRAFGAIVAHSTKESNDDTLPLLQKLDRAANPPPPLFVRKLRQLSNSPIGPLLPLVLSYLLVSWIATPVLSYFGGSSDDEAAMAHGGA